MGTNRRHGIRCAQNGLEINGTDSDTVLASTGGGLPLGMQVRQQNGTNLHNIREQSRSKHSTVGSRHSQVRAGKFRISSGGHYLQRVSSKLWSFKRGATCYSKKIKPTKEAAILRSCTKVHPSPTDSSSSTSPVFTAAAAARLSDEQLAINDALWSQPTLEALVSSRIGSLRRLCILS